MGPVSYTHLDVYKRQVWHSGDDDDDGYWCDHGWWEFDYDRYHARLTAEMEIHPDEKSPTASGNTLKSGYGIQETVTAGVSTNQSPVSYTHLDVYKRQPYG